MTPRRSVRTADGPFHGRWILAAFAVAIVARLIVFWIVVQHPDRAISPDSPLYLELSRDFPQAYLASDGAHRAASVLRTPGYPLFGYLWLRLFGDSVISILVAQNALSLVCVAMVFVLGRSLVSPAAGAWAAALAALDPLAVVYSNMIRNEVVFTAVLVFAALQWQRSLAAPRVARVVAAGLLFGLATLVRPVTTYLLLALIPADIWLRRRAAVNALTAWMAVGFLLPVGGWAARNYAVTGSAVVSTIEHENLLYYRAAGAVAEETGEARSTVATRIRLETDAAPDGLSLSGGPGESDRASALRLLARHPYGAAVSAIRGLARLLFGPGTAIAGQLVFGEPGRAATALVAVILTVYLGVVYIGVAAGVFALLRDRRRSPLVLLGAIVVYLALISAGPEAYSRFRAPLMPLLAVVGGVGLARS